MKKLFFLFLVLEIACNKQKLDNQFTIDNFGFKAGKVFTYKIINHSNTTQNTATNFYIIKNIDTGLNKFFIIGIKIDTTRNRIDTLYLNYNNFGINFDQLSDLLQIPKIQIPLPLNINSNWINSDSSKNYVIRFEDTMLIDHQKFSNVFQIENRNSWYFNNYSLFLSKDYGIVRIYYYHFIGSKMEESDFVLIK